MNDDDSLHDLIRKPPKGPFTEERLETIRKARKAREEQRRQAKAATPPPLTAGELHNLRRERGDLCPATCPVCRALEQRARRWRR